MKIETVKPTDLKHNPKRIADAALALQECVRLMKTLDEEQQDAVLRGIHAFLELPLPTSTPCRPNGNAAR